MLPVLKKHDKGREVRRFVSSFQALESRVQGLRGPLQLSPVVAFHLALEASPATQLGF